MTISVLTVRLSFGGIFQDVPDDQITQAINLAYQYCPEDLWGGLLSDGLLFKTAYFLAKWREEGLNQVALAQQAHSGNLTYSTNNGNTDHRLDSNYFFLEFKRLQDIVSMRSLFVSILPT